MSTSRQATGALAVEALALGLIVGGVTALSHSHLIGGETEAQPNGQASECTVGPGAAEHELAPAGLSAADQSPLSGSTWPPSMISVWPVM